jgi:serine/threonine protein kinase
MGVVYLGRDPVIGRRVALKTIRGAGEDDSEQREFSERFLREAQAAGTLSHPNIVTVHDVGEEEETATSFIAMEYVEGHNLKQILKDKTPLSFERVSEIVSSVADALDYAHRKGIVHRDVKPANIIITPDGTVKITDFGIAKIETSSLTSTGQFLGTPNYMSPEQVTGEEVDGRSDLFSLGVVLYELLTKRKPFVGDNLTSISYKIVHEDYPPPETFDATIPPEMGTILQKALAKDPAARFQKGMDFVQTLAEFRARLAERDMLRDLGAMVAEAEKLGSVSAVEGTGAPAAARNTGVVGALPGVSAQTGAIPIIPSQQSAGSTSLEDLARRGRADLDPGLANAPSNLESSIPDWSLDTSGMRGRAGKRTKKESARASGREAEEELAKEAVHEPPPSSPGTLISDVPRVAKVEAPDEKPAMLPAPPATEPSAKPAAASLAAAAASIASAVPSPLPSPPPSPIVPAAPATYPRPRPAAPSSPLENTGSIPRTAKPLFPAVPVPPPARGPMRPPTAAGAGPAPPPSSPGPRAAAPMPPPVPVPAPPREPTWGQRLPAPAPASSPAGAEAVASIAPSIADSAGALSAVSVKAALNSVMSRRVALAIVGGIAVAAFVVVGMLLQRRSSIESSGSVDLGQEKETSEKRALLDDGNRFLQAGKPVEAKEKFLELSRRAPESRTAREKIQQAEALLAKQQEEQRKQGEIQQRFAAAKEAESANEWARVLGEAEAILIVEPQNADAAALKANAQAHLVKKGGKLPAKSPVATAAPTKIAVAPAAAKVPEALPTAVPTPSAVKMAITFASPFRQGYVMVRRNDKEIYRKNFDFGKRSNGGTVEGEVEVPTGAGEFKVWVIDAEGSVREYLVLPLTVPGSERRTLTLQLDSAKKLNVALR